ncbi:MAG: 1-acyl-sn-glycerol-3-phosphate acyltransferase [Chlorobia bacterium]|nr:1-acyl-sn-glycerol-3-phosphate acyltransferase [Fimbriimonadaceae bacterium]
MIRRSVRKRFHTVYWTPPEFDIQAPAIFVPNHHGWFDGYLMFHVVTRLRVPTLDWIQEFDAFPLFAKIGGLPYPLGDPDRRTATVLKTIRLMENEGWSLLLFAEAELHYPPELLEFGKALATVARKVPRVQVIPVAIQYEMALHERPEAFIALGQPVALGDNLITRTRTAVAGLLNETSTRIKKNRNEFQILAKGIPDVNERWDLRRLNGSS